MGEKTFKNTKANKEEREVLLSGVEVGEMFPFFAFQTFLILI